MSTVTPFQSRKRTYASPWDMLRDLARLDAILDATLEADGGWYVGFEVPDSTHVTFDAIMLFLENCGETWGRRYLDAVLMLLAINDLGVERSPGFTARLRLWTSFVLQLPDDGGEAFRMLVELNDRVKRLPFGDDWLPIRSDEWLSVTNIRADLFRQMQDRSGTRFGQQVAAEARRFGEACGFSST